MPGSTIFMFCILGKIIQWLLNDYKAEVLHEALTRHRYEYKRTNYYVTIMMNIKNLKKKKHYSNSNLLSNIISSTFLCSSDYVHNTCKLFITFHHLFCFLWFYLFSFTLPCTLREYSLNALHFYTFFKIYHKIFRNRKW